MMKSWPPSSVLVFCCCCLFLISIHLSFGYHHKPCTPSLRKQFQLPNCYVPNLNPSLKLHEASFLMSHNSATGYMNARSRNISQLVLANLNNGNGLSDSMKMTVTNRLLALYGRTQSLPVYSQLQNGVRALDLRPKLYFNDSVGFHHGSMIDIPLSTVTLASLVAEVKQWCSENVNELVLLFHSELAHEGGYNYLSGLVASNETGEEEDYLYTGIAAMKRVYEEANVPYYSCEELGNLTVAEAMEMGDLSRFGGVGYLLAVDRHDMYASFCGKANWIESQLVSCYSTAPNTQSTTSPAAYIQCTDVKNSAGQYKLSLLQSYAKASANNDASDDTNTLGPPEDLGYYPFYQIQAFWQVDVTSVQVGLMHGSSLLDDNRVSGVNAEMVGMVYDGEFDSISLFSVDNVGLNGLALFSVLRNTCGQSTIHMDEEVPPCGRDVAMPRIDSSRALPILWDIALCLVYGVMLVGVMLMVVPAFRLRDEGPQDHRLVCNGQVV